MNNGLATSASVERPATLAELVASKRPPGLSERTGVIAFPYLWQVPAATEKAAFEAINGKPPLTSAEYLAFPWASLIDGLRGDATMAPDLLFALRQVARVPVRAPRRVTVAQHIRAMQYIELLRAAGITDVFWSHATHSLGLTGGLKVHAFPLFPAQTPTETPQGALDRPRRLLANFIGAYNPAIYLTNVRAAILADEGREPDVLVIKREAWHFGRAVYQEQVKGLSPDAQQRLVEQQHAEEYLQAIRDSWFTLCPSGSGPSSIRIFESLCLGSIPIVLTRDLRLVGPLALWNRAALIEDDSVEGYRRAVATARGMPIAGRVDMLRAGLELLEHVHPRVYHRIIVETLAQTET